MSRRSSRGIGRILGALAVVFALAVSAVPAQAALPTQVPDNGMSVRITTEVDIAVVNGGYPPWNAVCISEAVGQTCFEKYGDKIWVASGNGSLVMAYWSNWLWNGSSWQLYREGFCQTKSVQFGVCNKDFYEDSTYPNAYGSRGSGIRLSLCAGVCTPEIWIRNDQ